MHEIQARIEVEVGRYNQELMACANSPRSHIPHSLQFEKQVTVDGLAQRTAISGFTRGKIEEERGRWERPWELKRMRA